MRQLMEYRVQDLIIFAVQHHQTGGIAGVGRLLRDQLLRQVVPEIFF